VVLDCVVLDCVVLDCVVLDCVVLDCVVLDCVVLDCVVLDGLAEGPQHGVRQLRGWQILGCSRCVSACHIQTHVCTQTQCVLACMCG
jgi:hypothetical protein